jgi:hypothetical protein
MNTRTKARAKMIGAVVLVGLLGLFLVFRGGFRTVNLAEDLQQPVTVSVAL